MKAKRQTTRKRQAEKKTGGRTIRRPARQRKDERPLCAHAVHYRERFELADDIRKRRQGPLVYYGDYVSVVDDESATYLTAMEAMAHREDGLELEGAWSRIRRVISRRSRMYRGWVIDEQNLPASDTKIASWLHCPVARVQPIMQAFVDLGLFEWLPVPAWDPTENTDPEERPERPRKASRGAAGKAKRPVKQTSDKKHSGGRKVVFRSVPEHSGIVRSTPESASDERANGLREKEILSGQLVRGRLKGKRKAKGNGRPKGAAQRQTATAPAAANGGEYKGGQDQDKTRQARQGKQATQEPARPADSQVSPAARAQQIPGSKGQAQAKQATPSKPQAQAQPKAQEPANLPKSDPGAAADAARMPLRHTGKPRRRPPSDRPATEPMRMGDCLAWGNPPARAGPAPAAVTG